MAGAARLGEAAPRDATGEATLELFRRNDAYSELLWERLSAVSPRPVSGRLLEVGCGIGNLTRVLLRSREVTLLHAIDIDPAYVRRVAADLPDPRLRLAAAAAEEFCPEGLQGEEGGFDAIVSSNVLEHIEDHRRVLENFRRMLRRAGVALILVPAHPFLYSGLDRSLSHFRRYRRRDLRELAGAAGLEVLRLRHFNPLAALGWWLNGKVLRRATLPEAQLSLYARFAIPLSRWLDAVNPLPFGVSLLCALGRRE
ncbi:MAG: class I SAM-dependent methyltransferase [Planctomycetes bacterium]|nr:class I SAM-dependent methyltransferase [Planctomycetota bacterium]